MWMNPTLPGINQYTFFVIVALLYLYYLPLFHVDYVDNN